MNNKIEKILALLFVVATLLLMIGSVSAANAVELDENLETSIVVDADSSIDDNEFIPNLDDKVSSHATDDDETIGAVSSVDDNLNDINSKVVVSSEEKTTVNSKDSNEDILTANYPVEFNIIKKTTTPTVKVGDDVYYEIFVQNVGWQSFGGEWITVNDWFNPEELKYIDWYPNPVDASGQTWASNYGTPRETEDFWGHRVEVPYRAYYDFRPGYCFNFTLHFQALKDGQLNNSAHIWVPNPYDQWGPGIDFWGNETVYAGEPDLTIIKTPREPVVQVGDDVYFDVYIENTGTMSLITTTYWDPNSNMIWIDDWYDTDGLEFVDITFNPDKNGNVWPQNYQYAGEYDGPYGHQLLVQYLTYGNWEPGSSLNFTTHFKAKKTGQLNNSVHIFWKWKAWGPNEIHEHIEEWGNNSVLVGEPEFTLVKTSNNDTVNVGDMVKFTLNYTNTGIINLTGVFIKDNEYTDGLEYSDYSDKDLWTFDGTDTWYYNSELAPGESAILELTFQATTAGEKNNTAIAGHNITNETLNSTDTVLVVENETDTPEEPEEPEEEPKEPEEEPEEPEEPEEEPEEEVEEPSTPVVEKSIPVIPAAGNPLFVLLISLVLLCFVPLRGKK